MAAGNNLAAFAKAAALAAVLLLGGCRGVHKPSGPTGNAATTIHVGKPDSRRAKVVKEARAWIGTPYKYAGQEKGRGTDCSGMVMKVYEEAAGTKLPRNSARQAEACRPLRDHEVSAGDLVFFATGRDPGRVSHVGIVLDDRSFIHASSSKGVVVSDLFSPYYKRTFVMFGRVP